MQYLYARGCREIGLIDGAQHLAPYKDRYVGYCNALKELALESNLSGCEAHPVNSFEYGYECTNQNLQETGEKRKGQNVFRKTHSVL